MLPLIAALLPLATSVIDRVIPDKTLAAKVKAQLETTLVSNQHELQKSVLELAKEDAKAGKWGYRNAAGWLCVVSLAYSWIIRDLMAWVMENPPPTVSTDMQYTMLVGMLGLAGVRAHDLLKGTRK